MNSEENKGCECTCVKCNGRACERAWHLNYYYKIKEEKNEAYYKKLAYCREYMRRKRAEKKIGANPPL